MNALCEFFARCIPHHSVHDESTQSMPSFPSVVEFRPSNKDNHDCATKCISLLSGPYPTKKHSRRRFRVRNLRFLVRNLLFRMRNIPVDVLVPQTHEARDSAYTKRPTKVTRLQVTSADLKELSGCSGYFQSVALVVKRVAPHATILNAAVFISLLSYLWFHFPMTIPWQQ